MTAELSIHPVGLRDIASLYSGNVKYDTLREYSAKGVLPAPAAYINNTSAKGRTPVWDLAEVRSWAEARGWEEVTS
jgi:hypothetical protein